MCGDTGQPSQCIQFVPLCLWLERIELDYYCCLVSAGVCLTQHVVNSYSVSFMYCQYVLNHRNNNNFICFCLLAVSLFQVICSRSLLVHLIGSLLLYRPSLRPHVPIISFQPCLFNIVLMVACCLNNQVFPGRQTAYLLAYLYLIF